MRKNNNFIFFIFLIILHPLYGKNIVVDNNMSKVIEMSKYSSFLISERKEDKDFKYIIDFINNSIETYGEDNEYILLGYLALTRHYIAFGKFENANALFSFISEIKENQRYENNPILKILILHLKSDIYIKKGKTQKAYLLLSQAIKLAKKKKADTSLLMSLNNSYVKVLTKLRNYKEAERVAKEALELYKTTGKDSYDRESLIKVFVNYGEIYENKENYLFALKIMEVGLSILYKEDALASPSISLANFFIKYASYAYVVKKYDDTIFASKMDIDIEEKLGHSSNRPYMLKLIALAFKKQGKYQKAKEYYKKALLHFENEHSVEVKKDIIQIKEELIQMENHISKFKK